jgi:tetratricopeptide (TPR) repeat protein/DNA-binding CsgD family transcriptional regulator
MTLSRIYILLTLVLHTSFCVVQAQNRTIDSLTAVLQTVPDDTNRVNCLINLCYAYGETDINKMLETAHEALACAKRNNFERGMSDAYGLLGSAYADAGNQRKAVEFYLESLRIAEKQNDLKLMAINYHDLGSSYQTEGKYDVAIQYYQKAIAIWKQTGNKRGPVTVMYNTGYVYQQRGKDSLALSYYHETVKQGTKINNHYPVLLSLINMSGLYLKQKDYGKAHEYIEKALQLAANKENTNVLSEIYGVYSEIYAAEGRTEKAKEMAEKGLALAKRYNIKIYISQNYKRLADIYHSLGNPAKAYDFLSSYAALNDTIKSESNQAAIDKMVHSYELEKKDIELAAQVQQYESGIFRRNAFIGLLICLLLLAFLLYNRTKLILSSRQHQLKHYTQILLEKSTIISSITEELEALKSNATVVDENMEKFGKILHLKIHTEDEWENFKKAFDEVYPDFFNNLRYKYPGITAAELRLAAITKLNLSVKEAASMLGISAESVKQSRYRLKKRIGVPEDSTLKEYLEVTR